MKVVLWVGFIAATCFALLFSLVFVALLVDREIGAAVFVLLVTVAIPAWLAWLCRRTLRRRADQRSATASRTSGRSGGRPLDAPLSPPAMSDAAPVPHAGDSPSVVAEAPAAAPAGPNAPAVPVAKGESPTLRPARAEVRARRAPAGPSHRPRRSAAPTPGITFSYAAQGGKYRHDGPFAVVDVETTGFSSDGGDRVVEVAVLRCDAGGRVEDEWATLVNPDRDTGPVWVHHISNDAVAKAPRFVDVADELLARLDGAVVVAHNASFDEGFLRAELARAGRSGLDVPAVCSLWLSRQTLSAPNYKLGTLARTYGIDAVNAHSALGDVRAVSQLLPHMLEGAAGDLCYPSEPYRHGVRGVGAPPRLVTRAANLRRGDGGWMATMLDRLPMTGGEADDQIAHAYLEALDVAMADGKIIGDEAKGLARIAGQAGLGAAQVRALHERYLEGLREAAFEDDILTASELKDLSRAALMLGAPEYFDDLLPTNRQAPAVEASPRLAVETTGDSGQADVSPSPASGDSAPPRARRCGHCRQPGHYRPRCPELLAEAARAVRDQV